MLVCGVAAFAIDPKWAKDYRRDAYVIAMSLVMDPQAVDEAEQSASENRPITGLERAFSAMSVAGHTTPGSEREVTTMDGRFEAFAIDLSQFSWRYCEQEFRTLRRFARNLRGRACDRDAG